MSRFDRFDHLERRRVARDDPAAPPSSSPRADRFEAVERPATAPGATPAPRLTPATGARLERFGPEPDPVLELADVDGQQPFTRCAHCATDSHAFATACSGCGARLDTEDQRAFNERLWASRQAEAAREEAASAARRALQARDDVDEARARRALAEEMAREVGERERRRLDADRGGWSGDWGDGLGRRGGWSGAYDPTPLGLRLLRLLPGPGWQLAGGALAVVTVLGLVALGFSGLLHRRSGPLLGVAAFLAFALLAPPGRFSRRWWR